MEYLICLFYEYQQQIGLSILLYLTNQLTSLSFFKYCELVFIWQILKIKWTHLKNCVEKVDDFHLSAKDPINFHKDPQKQQRNRNFLPSVLL